MCVCVYIVSLSFFRQTDDKTLDKSRTKVGVYACVCVCVIIAEVLTTEYVILLWITLLIGCYVYIISRSC